MGQGILRHEERRLDRPAHDLLGAPHFFAAQRGAVGFGGVALGRGGIGDVGAEDDQGGAAGFGSGGFQRLRDGGEVVAVAHPAHLPSVGLEPAGDVFRKGERGVAIYGDVVVVVDQVELAQAEMAGDRGGLGGHSFHQVPVAHEGPHPVIHDPVAGPVEALGEDPLRDGHPHGVPHALAQRPGGGLHPGRVAPLGMSRRARAPLAERLDLLQWQVVAAQVQQRVEQQRGVAAGQHEAVAVGPGGIDRIVAQEPGPQHVGRRGERHRRARMPRLRGLHRIHGERADRIDAAPGQLGGGNFGLTDSHGALGVRGSGAGALYRQIILLSSAEPERGEGPRSRKDKPAGGRFGHPERSEGGMTQGMAPSLRSG